VLDLRFVRQNAEFVRDALTRRGGEFDLAHFAQLEQTRKSLTERAESLRHLRNTASKRIGEMKRLGADASEAIAEAEAARGELSAANAALESFESEYRNYVLGLPNLPEDDVPDGASEIDNVEIGRVGAPPKFEWTPRDHIELGAKLGLEFERASRLSGSRFALLRGDLARLNRALASFMLDVHVHEHGYEEVNVPVLVRRDTLVGTGQLPKFEHDQFHVAGDEDMFLIPTSEVPLTSLYRDEILDAARLPLKFVAHSLCFRREAGSYGKDTRGMIRMHQFEKVELVQIVAPQDSSEVLETLTRHAEIILERLELPYRRMALCAADLGFSAARTFDLEVWLPSQKRYREISSCSHCRDFQARRMGCRMRIESGAKGMIDFPHTLNGSGVAIGRCLIAVMENFQDADGNIVIPDALRPYMGGAEKLFAKSATKQ